MASNFSDVSYNVSFNTGAIDEEVGGAEEWKKLWNFTEKSTGEFRSL